MSKIILLLIFMLLLDLTHGKLSEVPPPPKRPERFHSREELKRYLQKVHEYHAIVGRWRLRRQIPDQWTNWSIDDSSSFPIDHST